MANPTGTLKFNFTVMGETQLQRALAGRLAAIEDLSEPLGTAADLIQDGISRTFEKEGGYQGKPSWPPLSPRYKAWKDKHHPGQPILVRTGAMKAAFTGGSGSIREVGKQRLEVGGSHRLGGYHQGPDRPKTRVPRRPFIMLSRTEKNQITKLIVLHINQEKH